MASVDRRSFFNSSRVGVVPKSSIKSRKLKSNGSGRGGGEAGAYSGEVKGESLRASITSRVGGGKGGSGSEVSAGAGTSGRTDINASCRVVVEHWYVIPSERQKTICAGVTTKVQGCVILSCKKAAALRAASLIHSGVLREFIFQFLDLRLGDR